MSTSNNAKAYSSGTHFRAVAYINPLGGSYVLERRLSDVVAVGTHTNLRPLSDSYAYVRREKRFLSKWLERVLREGCSIQVCFVSFLTGVPDQEIRQQPARWGRTVYLPDRRAPRLHSPRLSALRTASRPAAHAMTISLQSAGLPSVPSAPASDGEGGFRVRSNKDYFYLFILFSLFHYGGMVMNLMINSLHYHVTSAVDRSLTSGMASLHGSALAYRPEAAVHLPTGAQRVSTARGSGCSSPSRGTADPGITPPGRPPLLTRRTSRTRSPTLKHSPPALRPPECRPLEVCGPGYPEKKITIWQSPLRARVRKSKSPPGPGWQTEAGPPGCQCKSCSANKIKWRERESPQPSAPSLSPQPPPSAATALLDCWEQMASFRPRAAYIGLMTSPWQRCL